MSIYKYIINPHTGQLQKVLDEDSLSIPENISDLDDVDFNSGTPVDDDIMRYDSASGKWKSESPSGGSIPVTKILYVDNNRTDEYVEDGSLTNPFKTIVNANTSASIGNIILVLPGIYNESIITKQGVIYYANTGNYKDSNVFMSNGFTVDVDDVYIIGFDFQSTSSHAVQILNTSINNLHILRNRIYNAGNDPILFNSTPAVAHTNIYINDNYIEKVDGSFDSGIWFYHVTRGEIKNNIIWTIGYNGIIAEGIQDIVISGNDIRACRQSAIQVASSSSSNTQIENNYFKGNNTSSTIDKGAIAIYPSADDLKIRYNIFEDNYNGFCVRDKSGVVSSDVYVNYNKFLNSTSYGIKNLAQGGGELNAKWNWYGDSSGCDDDAGVINGSGDKITTNVVAEPLQNYGNRGIDIRNDSSITGVTVKNALETLGADSHSKQHSIINADDHFDKVDYIDIPYSPMILTGGILSEGTNAGTLKVSALTALLRTTDSTNGALIKITLAEQDNQVLTSADIVYQVILDYNDNSPQILIQVANGDGKRQINIGDCIKESDNTVHYNSGGFRFADGIKKLHHRAKHLRNWEMGSEIAIADEGSKHFSIASGYFHKGINHFAFSGFDSSQSSPDTFTYVYYNGTDWVYVADQTEIDVDNYNNVASGLSACNRYKCDWVFVHPDHADVFIVYGQDDDNFGNISDSTVPTGIPDLIDTFGTLIGRIIVDGGVATFERIEMLQHTTFNPQVVIKHNDNSSIQGGITDEYYHLTSAEHTNKYIQNNEIKIKMYNQDEEPDLEDQKLAMWIDTNDSDKVYLLFRRGSGDQVKVELA